MVPTRFRVRVLAKKFGKKFTTLSRSPVISLAPAPLPPGFVESLPDGDCDNDGTQNKDDGDDDNDGLSDAVEQSLNLNPCAADTDADGVEDRFEYDCDRNGVLNRDENDDDKDLLTDGQEDSAPHGHVLGRHRRRRRRGRLRVPVGARPQRRRVSSSRTTRLPFPGKRPYPNPLFPDAGIDYDGDVADAGRGVLALVATSATAR